MRSTIILFVLLAATFLIAAKTHGRQYRLERELEGHWSVSFTSPNHPWVDAFWLKHRIIYWSIVGVSFLLILWKTKGQIFVRIPLAFITSMILAFVTTGLWSAARLTLKISSGTVVPNDAWLNDAIWGSIGFWLFTALSVLVLSFYARANVHTILGRH